MLNQKFLEEMKKQSRTGRCLHFNDGKQCTEYIEAHSIQKSGQLSKISENGHVYRVDFDSSEGKLFLKKTGIRKVSTFPGFCKTHDNDLFKPIDSCPLHPTLEQIALYAYRCVCREFFVKSAAVKTFNNLIVREEMPPKTKEFLRQTSYGHELGLINLTYHKILYDKSLKEKVSDFHYVVFESKDEQFMQMSGLLYPDYDFSGNFLQRLGDLTPPNQLITYFTAPTKAGWAFCFAWHTSSNQVCQQFIKSFATHCYTGRDPGAALLRFVCSTCENHAFKISWWDGLRPEAKIELLKRIALSAHPHEPIPSNYLEFGCENIANITFDRVWPSY